MAQLISTEPATGALLWQGETGDVDAEVAQARAGWAEWAARPSVYRAEALRRFANVVRARAEPFADLIARETGKPLWDARAEIEAVVAQVDAAIGAYAERTAQRRIEGALGARNALRHKPHGVLGVVTSFAMPAQIPSGHIVPALIAGNAVVFKPSERTPASGAFLVDCLHEAGVPRECVRLLVGGPDEGRALAAHPGTDGLLFTGSSRTGIAIHKLFAGAPHRVLALEMGGNNPLVVWDAVDIHTAAVMVVQAAFSGAGQRCTAARRLIVKDGAHEPLLAEIGKIIGRMIIAEPHSLPAPFIGPMIDNEAADRLQECFLDLILKGGRAIRHLERPIEGRPFLTPGLIDVTGMAGRPDEELFGPVLQLVRVPDFDAAIAEANATRYGLTAALIGGPPQLYDRFWANIRAGVVNWNRPTAAPPLNAPFGGVGISGNHRPAGSYAADFCAHPVVSSEAELARASIGIGLRDN